MKESPTTQLRYDALVAALTARARNQREAERLAELIGLLTEALPAERVAAAYRAVRNAA